MAYIEPTFLPCYGIVVNASDGGGSISSDLHEEGVTDATEYNAAMDGIESMILACACAGIDIESPAFIEAIETAVEGCANNL